METNKSITDIHEKLKPLILQYYKYNKDKFVSINHFIDKKTPFYLAENTKKGIKSVNPIMIDKLESTDGLFYTMRPEIYKLFNVKYNIPVTTQNDIIHNRRKE